MADIEYILEVDSVCPMTGSIAGGAALTITGRGFSEADEDLNEVFVGDSECDIDYVSDTTLLCTIEERGVKHHVNNSGIHQGNAMVYFKSNVL